VEHFLDIFEASLNKRNETLCGDKVKVHRDEEKTIIVLSDGLGSGVKANILATLTSVIIITMLAADVGIEEVMRTVIGTLPTCKVRNIAYATFTVIQISHTDHSFKVINFDNPPTFHFRHGKIMPTERQEVEILGRKVKMFEGQLELGDFLGAMSDGVPYAGMGVALNFGWGWDNIARYIEERWLTHYWCARDVVRDVIGKTRSLYRDEVGDDATFVGVFVRPEKGLLIFTGPPLEKAEDDAIVERFLAFNGTKIVCGGTTSNIVADHMGDIVQTDLKSLRKDIPPIGSLPGVDLLTEGILTMSRALEYLRDADGNPSRLPNDRNAATLLATHLLRADHIHFLVGQQINEYYQNPLLPKSISIRKHLVRELADFLTEQRKEVTIEYC
jgi:hypothetical protein